MPDLSTSMMSSSSGDAGVTPFVVPDNPQQQSTMAKFLHGMAMTHLGLAGMEFQQQQQQKMETAKMYSEALQSQPNLAGDEHFMKGFAEVTSPNLANAMGMWAHSADIQRKLAQKQVEGIFQPQSGATPTMTGPNMPSELPATSISQGPTPPHQQPEGSSDRIAYLKQVVPQAEKFKLTQAYLNLPEAQQKAVDEQLKGYEEELRRWEFDSPQAKAQAKTAETQAGIDVETSPANVSAKSKSEATIAAAKSGAESRAKLAPDIVAGNVSEAAQKSEAEAKAKGGSPEEAEAKRGQDLIKSMRANWETNHPAGWFTSSSARAQAFGQFAKDHGVDPDTGRPVPIIAKSGRKMIRDPKSPTGFSYAD